MMFWLYTVQGIAFIFLTTIIIVISRGFFFSIGPLQVPAKLTHITLSCSFISMC